MIPKDAPVMEPRGGAVSKAITSEAEAVKIAAGLMADMGCCIHDPGYYCLPDACPACIERWLLRKARVRLKES